MTKYCRRVGQHDYQLYLAINDIDHSKTKAVSSQTNGICERFHKTMQDEFYVIAFRKKLYRSLDDLQADVNEWLKSYNETRPHFREILLRKKSNANPERCQRSCAVQKYRYCARIIGQRTTKSAGWPVIRNRLIKS